MDGLVQWGSVYENGPTSMLCPGSSMGAGAWRPGPQARTSWGGAVPTCQVEGCCADLSKEEKPYCMKKRICSGHMRADCIMRPGDDKQLWRFCFQCGKLEPLSNFDGPKRSCRARLERRKLPPRRSMTWSAGAWASRGASSTSNDASTGQPASVQQQQQHLLLLQEIQQQQTLLNQMQQQMSSMQQQPQMLANPTLCGSNPATHGMPASPEALALLQEQQTLLEHKRRQLQVLKAAMSHNGVHLPNLSPAGSGPTTPSVLAPSPISFGMMDKMSPGQFSPSTSLGFTATGQGFSGVDAMPGYLNMASLTGQAVSTAGQGVPTAAAAAAALSDSSNWPFVSMQPAATTRSTGGSLQSREQSPSGLEMCDEFDPMEWMSRPDVFPELDLVRPAAGAQVQKSQDLTAEQEALADQLSASLEAAIAAVNQPAAPHVHGGALTTAPVLSATPEAAPLAMPSAGWLQGGGSQQLGPHTVMPSALQAEAPQQLQLQQLMQTIQSLHQTVQELSLRVGVQGAPSPTPSGTGVSASTYQGMN